MAGLGVLEQQPVGVEGQAGHHHHAAVAVQVQQGLVPGGGALHRHAALGGGDADVQHLFDVLVDGPGRDPGGQAGDHRLGKIVHVQNQGLALQVAHPLDGPQGLAHHEPALGGQALVGLHLLEPHHLGHGVQVVALVGLLKALDHPDQEGGLARRPVDHPHPLALDGLQVAGGGQVRQGPAQGVAGAAVLLDQLALGGQQGLVRVVLGLDLLLDAAADAFKLCFGHGIIASTCSNV